METNTKLIAVAAGAFILSGLVVMAALPRMGDHDGYVRGNRDGNERGMMNGYDDKRSKDTAGANQTGMMGQHMMADGSVMGGDMGMIVVASEREFIEGMIPHHEEAVSTAKEVVSKGGSTPEIKTLAQNIIIAQEKEIADMKMWYKNWYGVEYVSNNKYQPMMRPLANLSGAELDKVFLTDMVKHHMMAIMMAKSVDGHIEHTEVKDLSAAIQKSQSAEITTMQNILKTL